MSLWKLPHVFLEFIRSVVGGLLKTTCSVSSGRRRRINASVGLHHPANVETQGCCSNCKKHCRKCQECGVCVHPMCFLDYYK